MKERITDERKKLEREEKDKRLRLKMKMKMKLEEASASLLEPAKQTAGCGLAPCI